MGKRVFSFTVECLPMPTPVNRKEMDTLGELIRSLDGLVAVSPYCPFGDIFLFETLNDAKRARNAFRQHGRQCAKYIMNAEIADDNSNVTICDVAE